MAKMKDGERGGGGIVGTQECGSKGGERGGGEEAKERGCTDGRKKDWAKHTSNKQVNHQKALLRPKTRSLFVLQGRFMWFLAFERPPTRPHEPRIVPLLTDFTHHGSWLKRSCRAQRQAISSFLCCMRDNHWTTTPSCASRHICCGVGGPRRRT